MKISVLSYNIEGITLEENFKKDNSLTQYIISKAKILREFLLSQNADIICIQEYTPILFSELLGDVYQSVIQDRNAIFFKKNKFKFLSGKYKNRVGLTIKLDANGTIFYCSTDRLVPSSTGTNKRKKSIKAADSIAAKKLFIYAVDTNMRKSEEKSLDNLTDCFKQATITNGFYTLDKKFNPYFFTDGDIEIRTRYDKIFISKEFDCEQLDVLRPKSNLELVHTTYPYGNLSDHYPLMAILCLDLD